MLKRSLLSLLFALLFGQLISAGERVTVHRVIDGDTIETAQGVKVRLVGINAPEIKDLFGEEAKQHLRALVEGKTIDLVRDNISSDRDRYDRLLRYLVLDGSDINKRMVEEGFAFAYLKFRFEKSDEYVVAEKKARMMAAGIWSRGDANTIAAQQENESSSRPRPIRVYIVAVLVLLLIGIGIYFYIRK